MYVAAKYRIDFSDVFNKYPNLKKDITTIKEFYIGLHNRVERTIKSTHGNNVVKELSAVNVLIDNTKLHQMTNNKLLKSVSKLHSDFDIVSGEKAYHKIATYDEKLIITNIAILQEDKHLVYSIVSTIGTNITTIRQMLINKDAKDRINTPQKLVDLVFNTKQEIYNYLVNERYLYGNFRDTIDAKVVNVDSDVYRLNSILTDIINSSTIVNNTMLKEIARVTEIRPVIKGLYFEYSYTFSYDDVTELVKLLEYHHYYDLTDTGKYVKRKHVKVPKELHKLVANYNTYDWCK